MHFLTASALVTTRGSGRAVVRRNYFQPNADDAPSMLPVAELPDNFKDVKPAAVTIIRGRPLNYQSKSQTKQVTRASVENITNFNKIEC